MCKCIGWYRFAYFDGFCASLHARSLAECLATAFFHAFSNDRYVLSVYVASKWTSIYVGEVSPGGIQ